MTLVTVFVLIFCGVTDFVTRVSIAGEFLELVTEFGNPKCRIGRLWLKVTRIGSSVTGLG